MGERCGEVYELPETTTNCVRAPGHDGQHYDGLLVRWEDGADG